MKMIDLAEYLNIDETGRKYKLGYVTEEQLEKFLAGGCIVTSTIEKATEEQKKINRSMVKLAVDRITGEDCELDYSGYQQAFE